MAEDKRQTIKRELFYALFVLLTALVVLELVWPNIVLAYFNLNFLFLAVIISGFFAFKKL